MTVETARTRDAAKCGRSQKRASGSGAAGLWEQPTAPTVPTVSTVPTDELPFLTRRRLPHPHCASSSSIASGIMSGHVLSSALTPVHGLVLGWSDCRGFHCTVVYCMCSGCLTSIGWATPAGEQEGGRPKVDAFDLRACEVPGRPDSRASTATATATATAAAADGRCHASIYIAL